MALDTFEHPIYAQRKYFVQEIAGLDDVFDFSTNGHRRNAISPMR
ncbi:hypothetical protein [Rhizobium leguminosarum]